MTLERRCRRPGEAEGTLLLRARRGRSLLVAARLAVVVVVPGLAPSAAAQPADSDWPCIQRLVPQLAASQMWAGPSAGSGENASRPETTQLAQRLASRSLPVYEAEAAIDGFVEGLPPEERNAELAHLFRDVLQLINQERSRIIAGIKRYTRKQRQLAEKIAQDSRELADLQPGTTPDAATQELLEARQWDLRVFEDRQRVLRQICEQPVRLEQRAFALSRAMQSELEPE
jgi:hypothetical protein